MSNFNFVGKRYCPHSDECSGLNGKYRPTTYGVYDNLNGRIYYINGWKANTWIDAANKANELNELDGLETILQS